MNDTAREEASALWLRIIHTYEREPVSTDASEVRSQILDDLSAMIRAVTESERLRAKFKPMKCGHPAYNDDSYGGCVACQFHAQAEADEAENERLRAALEYYAEHHRVSHDTCSADNGAVADQVLRGGDDAE